jgi:hypothetical protein
MAESLTRRDMLRYSLGAAGLGSLRMDDLLTQNGSEQGDTAEFHVSPQGDDNSSGTLQQPFKSLDRAKAAVRALLVRRTESEQPSSISVLIHQGRYELHDTFTLDDQDSGSSLCSIPGAQHPERRLPSQVERSFPGGPEQ